MNSELSSSSSVPAVMIDVRERYQTIHNFGASDAWSMDPIGREWDEANKNAVADLLFSAEKGIGLSGWRFNIGAGSAETDQEIIAGKFRWRRSEAFRMQEADGYDWTKQAGQQWFLQAAKRRGVKQFYAFVNSPPVWMTKNGHGQADDSVGSTNLQPGCEAKFARFLADVLEHFRDEEGIAFGKISSINEPTWAWNRSTQEGNRYNNEELKQVVNALYDELERRGLSTEIETPEAVEWAAILDDAYYRRFTGGEAPYSAGMNGAGCGSYREYIKELLGDPKMRRKVANTIAVHSYFSDERDGLTRLRELARQNIEAYGGELAMTEYCILGDYGEGRDLGIDPALHVAKVLHHDLAVAGVTAWQWWTAVSKEDFKDGLIYTDYFHPGDPQNILPSKILWTLGQYSKFIRPGASRIKLDGPLNDDPDGLLGSAYVDETNGSVIAVLTNPTPREQAVRFRFENVPAGKRIRAIVPHVTSPSDDLRPYPPVPADAFTAGYTLPAKSVVTFVAALT